MYTLRLNDDASVQESDEESGRGLGGYRGATHPSRKRAPLVITIDVKILDKALI